MNEKNLALFLYEVGLILYGEEQIIITDDPVNHINSFIYQYYQEYEDSFSLLYNMELLNEFIDNDYEVLPMQIVMQLIIKYSSDYKYAQLVEEVGYKTDQKINDLALSFIMYLQELSELYNRKPNGYLKILH